MTIKIEVDGLLKKYEDNDSKNLAKASKALSEKDTWHKSIIDENGEEVNITLLLAYEYSKGIENITNGIVSFDEALSKLMEIDNLVLGEFNENNDDILYGKNYQDKTMMMANSQEYYDTVRKHTGAMNFCYFDKNGKLADTVAIFKEVRDSEGKKLREGATFHDLTDLRDTFFHEVTHHMEKDFVPKAEPQMYTSIDGRTYSNYDKVDRYRKVEYVNGARIISEVIDLPAESQFNISTGLTTTEILPNGEEVIHNQVTEGFVQAVAVAITRSLGCPEQEIRTDKYFEKTQMAFKVIEARDKDLGQGQTFADFIRHSYQIKGELEQIHVQGKNALQYISDYGEMSDRGKTTKSKIIRGFGYLGKKLDYPLEKQEEIENSRILGKTELTEDETENLRTMLLNGKTDAESKEIVDDFVGRYTGALAEEKSFFDAIPSQLDFSKFKTEEIGIDEYIKKQEAKHISMKDIVKNAISNGLDLEQVEQMDRVENVLSNERNEEGVTKDEYLYAKAYTEVLEIINHFSEDEYKKIPKEKIDFYEKHKDRKYDFKINPNIDLAEQNISRKANAILVSLFRDYFATAKQKEILKNLLQQNQEKLEIKRFQAFYMVEVTKLVFFLILHLSNFYVLYYFKYYIYFLHLYF